MIIKLWGVLRLLFLTASACLFLFSNTLSQVPMRWQKTLGGSGTENLNSMAATSDGGYVLTGRTMSTDGDVSGGHGDFDYWVVKIDDNGNLLWQKCFGGTDEEEPMSIIQTSDNGFLVVGFANSSDGDVSVAYGMRDTWVIKLDSFGNLEWEKSFGGSASDWAMEAIQSTDGGFVITGQTNSTDGHISFNHGSLDIWVIKIDSSGNLLWEKTYGGSMMEHSLSIKQKWNGGYVIAGSTYSNDGDVTGLYGDVDYWIITTDSTGNPEWMKCYGGTDYDESTTVALTADSGFVVGGRSNSNDLDVSGNHGYNDCWVVKLDSSGIIQWERSYGGFFQEMIMEIIVADDGGLLWAASAGSYDGDLIENCGVDDFWIAKTDINGNLEWHYSFGGSDYDRGMSLVEDANGDVVISGYSYSDNGYLINGSNSGDFWVVKISPSFNLITGKLFIDLNSNNIQDPGEAPVSNRKIIETNSGRFNYSKLDGNYSISILDTGNFIVMNDLFMNYYDAEPPMYSVNFNSVNEVDSLNDFAFQPNAIINDLCITLTPMGMFRSGFDAGYMLNYKNLGTTTINNITINFLPDINLDYISSSSTPSQILPDTISWNIGSLSPYQEGSILVNLNISPGLVIGTLINSGTIIEPVAGDANPGCNTDYYESLITGSFDPNDIIVDRAALLTTEFPNPPFLEYLIRFQNTGNDTAFNVKVLNSIAQELEINSFELISASHPVNISYTHASRLMQFKFDNILLVDSIANEPLSHGFIRYRIRPVSGLVLNDSIMNTAGIFFDFNSPVITNTALTTVILPSGIEDQVSVDKLNLIAIPNPSKGTFSIHYLLHQNHPGEIVIYNVMGESVYKSNLPAGSYKHLVDFNDQIKGGVYVCRVISAGKSESVKLVVY